MPEFWHQHQSILVFRKRENELSLYCLSIELMQIILNRLMFKKKCTDICGFGFSLQDFTET